MFPLLLRAVIWVVSTLFAVSIVLVLLFRFVNPPITGMQIARANEAMANDQPIRIEREWKPLEKISPHLRAAVVASEDQLFYEHFGFDFNSIEKAANTNQRSRTVRGASTLSQQVAKNLFLWPGRDWVRKGLEAYFTLLIELAWPKERILEVYLNIAEMGNGFFGAEMAAEKYFDKRADQLTLGQAALIAAALPNPRKFNPGKPNRFLRTRAIWIVRAVKRQQREAEELWETEEETTTPPRTRKPSDAPPPLPDAEAEDTAAPADAAVPATEPEPEPDTAAADSGR